MFQLYIFALLVHAAYSSTACKDGVEVVSKETKNPNDIVGTWNYVYHWDNLNKFDGNFTEVDLSADCPQMRIEVATPEFIKAKETECSDSETYPFKWSDAKLKVNAPHMSLMGGIITIGEKENWLLIDCKKMLRVVLRQMSDDYIVMVNPDMANISELLSKKVPTLDELRCIAHNADVGKSMNGIGLCYKI